MKHLLRIGLASLLLAAIAGRDVGAAPANRAAATIIVTTIDDEFGDGAACSLREAIQAANTDTAFGGCPAGSGPDTIVFSDSTPTTTFTLSLAGAGEDNNATGDLDITADLTITGNLSNTTNIDGGAIDTILTVHAGANVTLSRLTLRNGKGVSYPGAIFNFGTLTIEYSTINNNTANVHGGAVSNAATGVMTISDTNIVGNTTTGTTASGGAIYNRGWLTYRRGTISDNSVVGNGGAIGNNGGSVTISEATINNNTAAGDGGAIANDSSLILGLSRVYGNQTTGEGSDGGAIFNTGNTTVISSSLFTNNAMGDGGTIYNGSPAGSGLLALRSSEVSLGTAGGNGGGIYNNGGFSSTNATISGNQAAAGAGIYNAHATAVIQLTNVTIAKNQNTPASAGAGIHNAAAGANFHLRNTLIADNGSAASCVGPLVSDGHNLDRGTSCSFNAAGDLSDINPGIGTLQINGNTANPSFTHALVVSSPAIDAGANCPIADQRMVFRPRDGNNDNNAVCDIGAFEAPGNAPPAAAPDAYETDAGTPLSETAPGVLANDSDPDSDPLTAVLDQAPDHGTLTLNSDGSFSYTPDSGFSGIDRFTYHVTDGSIASAPTTVSLRVGKFLFVPLLRR